MPQKPTKEEADEYESFARAALGKRKDNDPPTKKKVAAPVDTARLKKDIDKDVVEYKTSRSAVVRGSADPQKGTQAQAAFKRMMAREDSLRQERDKRYVREEDLQGVEADMRFAPDKRGASRRGGGK